MFVRFVIAPRHRNAGVQTGIVSAIDRLPRVGQLADWDEARLTELIDWFRANLPYPDRIARSRRPNGHEAAVSRFKPSAKAHIEKAREFAAILDANDIRTEVIMTDRPGSAARICPLLAVNRVR